MLFGGFPQILYDQRYPAPGDRALAEQAAQLISAAGLPAGIDTARGLDHGAWVPLKLMYPANDIPVVQLSVQTHLGPAHHYKLGQALRPLLDEEVLILGSGSFTHNLGGLAWSGPNEAPDWVTGFADWVSTALANRRIEDLLDYRRLAPFAGLNHPTEEHFLPLFVTLGAGGPKVKSLHKSVTFSVLRMDAFGFAA